MTAAKTGSRSKANAARAEVTTKQKTTKYLGITLDLPQDLPPTFSMDVAEMLAGSPGAVYQLVVSLIGQDQYRAVREKIATGKPTKDGGAQVLVDLLSQITNVYGAQLGE